jgi:disulfide bond formation protein DsbB
MNEPNGQSVSRTSDWLTLLIALLAIAGSLYLSLGMYLKACPLCFYQRSFAMGVAAVLVMGMLTGRRQTWLLALVLPMIVAGLGVAGFHVYLESIGKLECPKGVFGLGTAPQQSLAAFFAMSAAAGYSLVQSRASSFIGPSAAIMIGVLLAWGSIASAPPLPSVPVKAYEGPFDICRPPFRGQ